MNLFQLSLFFLPLFTLTSSLIFLIFVKHFQFLLSAEEMTGWRLMMFLLPLIDPLMMTICCFIVFQHQFKDHHLDENPSYFNCLIGLKFIFTFHSMATHFIFRSILKCYQISFLFFHQLNWFFTFDIFFPNISTLL